MTSTNKKPESVKCINCPTCGTSVKWIEENTFRPFCSERCQLIDFGDWATEKNTIPVKEPLDNLSFSDQSEFDASD